MLISLLLLFRNFFDHSQFFITLDACDWIDRKHTIFGKVVGNTSIFSISVTDNDIVFILSNGYVNTNSFFNSSNLSSLRPINISLQPSSANLHAHDFPIPAVAPVINTITS